MAVSGSATEAYKYTPQGDTVRVERTTSQRGLCASPAEAVALVLAGKAATVAGSDAWETRDLLAAAGKAVRP